MNKFVNAARRQKIEARTENNMKALKSTTDACVDLFFHIGASRGKDITPLFSKAFAGSPEHAVRIALWARDVRGGAGERQLFRDILLFLEKNEPQILLHTNFLSRVPELGRWDDLLVLQTPQVRKVVNKLISDALVHKNGLCAKWMPRKGARAALLRSELGWTPKFYRKTLVNLTTVVETAMCSKDWTSINFEHVPSLAMARYAKAFGRNALEHYLAYKQKLQTGEAKINAAAVYPYNVIQTLRAGDAVIADEMWKALPNYMDDQNVLPVVDVSGSMTCPAGGNPNVTCLDVSVSLGLYCADKNKGAFKDTFVTFSGSPELLHLKGKLSTKLSQMEHSNWEMNTNLHAAMQLILGHALVNKVPQKDMPTALLIMSDMQFDQCTTFDDSAYEMISRKFEDAGYQMPAIVFWNLNSHSNVPVDFKKKGVALVSGFSPAIMKSVLAADFDKMTPESIMLQTIMNDRYSFSEEV